MLTINKNSFSDDEGSYRDAAWIFPKNDFAAFSLIKACGLENSLVWMAFAPDRLYDHDFLR